MRVTLEITVESIEEYLLLLNVLDRPEENGELDFPMTAGSSRDSFSAIAEDATSLLCEETSAAWSFCAPSRRTP